MMCSDASSHLRSSLHRQISGTGAKVGRREKEKKSALSHFWYPCVLSEQRTFCQKRFLQHLSPSVRTELPRGLEIFPASRHRTSIYDHSSLPQICLTSSYLPFLLFEWKITERKQMESNKKLGGWLLRVGEANARRKSDASDGGFLLKPICGSLGQIKLYKEKKRITRLGSVRWRTQWHQSRALAKGENLHQCTHQHFTLS